MKVVDKLTAIDIKAATSAGEIATGLSQFASLAGLNGIDIDQASAMVATIADVSQASGSSVGQALKTIISRYGAVKAGSFANLNTDYDTSEQEGSLNDVERVLNKIGIAIRDTNLQFRDFDTILEELGEKWSSLDNVSQNAVATAFAGTRQRNSFITLLNNMDKYHELLETSQKSAGTAQKKYEAYQESIEAWTKKLQAAWEELANNADINQFIKTILKFSTFIVKQLPIIVKYLLRILTVTQSFKLGSLVKVLGKFFSPASSLKATNFFKTTTEWINKQKAAIDAQTASYEKNSAAVDKNTVAKGGNSSVPVAQQGVSPAPKLKDTMGARFGTAAAMGVMSALTASKESKLVSFGGPNGMVETLGTYEMSDKAKLTSAISTGVLGAIGAGVAGPVGGMIASLLGDVLNTYVIGPLVDADKIEREREQKNSEQIISVMESISSPLNEIKNSVKKISDWTDSDYAAFDNAVEEIFNNMLGDENNSALGLFTENFKKDFFSMYKDANNQWLSSTPEWIKTLTDKTARQIVTLVRNGGTEQDIRNLSSALQAGKSDTVFQNTLGANAVRLDTINKSLKSGAKLDNYNWKDYLKNIGISSAIGFGAGTILPGVGSALGMIYGAYAGLSKSIKEDIEDSQFQREYESKISD